MADIFVSYKAEDRRRVALLVEALEADGFSVWWDAHIGGGEGWRDLIQQHLDEAKCVIVVWSKRSIGPQGHFVRDEASRAQRRQKYLPVRIDKVDPPLGFGEVQAIPLIRWKGDRSDPRYQSVLASARAIVSGKPRPQEVHVEEPGIDRRFLIAGGGVVALAAAGGGWFLLRRGSAGASNDIAVLPFANLSGDPAQAYFSDGMAEELRTALSRIPELRVMARTSSEKLRNEDIETVARKLDVGNILTGSVRRSPSLIRVTAQLVDGRNGLERWSEVYDRPIGDTLMIQRDIAEKVAAALSIELGRAERAALTAGGTSNPAAQDLFLRANAAWISNPDRDGLSRAIDLFDEAIRIDPAFAEAYARKGHAIRELTSRFARSGSDFEPGLARAEAAAREALRLAPGLKTAYVTLASTRVSQLDFKGALAFFEQAEVATSNDIDAMLAYAEFIGNVGRPDEAVELANRAIAIDPLNPSPHNTKVWMLLVARRYAESVGVARELLKWAPDQPFSQLNLAFSLLFLGKAGEARAVLAEARLDPDWKLFAEGMFAARTGDRAGSDRALARLSRMVGDAMGYQYAQIHAQRGDSDLAFRTLDRAVEVRDPGLLFLPTDPFVDPLRSDPRFAALVKKLDFPSVR